MILLYIKLARFFVFLYNFAHFGTIFTHKSTHNQLAFRIFEECMERNIATYDIPPLFKKRTNRSEWTTAISFIALLISILDRFALATGQFVYLLSHHCSDGRIIGPLKSAALNPSRTPTGSGWAKPLNLSVPLSGSSAPLPPMTVNPPRSLSTRHMIRKPGMSSLRVNLRPSCLQDLQEPVQHFRAGLKVQGHLLSWQPVLNHYVNQDGIGRYPTLQGPEPVPGLIQEPDVRQTIYAELQPAQYEISCCHSLSFKI